MSITEPDSFVDSHGYTIYTIRDDDCKKKRARNKMRNKTRTEMDNKLTFPMTLPAIPKKQLIIYFAGVLALIAIGTVTVLLLCAHG